MVNIEDIKKFFAANKNKIIIVMVIVLVVLIVISAIGYKKTNESFGKLQRVKLLAEAANRVEKQREAEAAVEGFNGPRGDMMFPGQFDYLSPKTSAVSQEAKQQVAQQIAQPVLQQAQALEQVAQQKIQAQQAQQIAQQQGVQQIVQSVQQAIQGQAQTQPVQALQVQAQAQPVLGQQQKRQVLQQVQQRVQPQAVQAQLEQSAQQTTLQGQHAFDDGQMLDNQRDVQSNSGNSLQSQSAESFAHSRIYRQFDNLIGGVEASEEAQKAEQVQTTVEMKAMQQQLA